MMVVARLRGRTDMAELTEDQEELMAYWRAEHEEMLRRPKGSIPGMNHFLTPGYVPKPRPSTAGQTYEQRADARLWLGEGVVYEKPVLDEATQRRKELAASCSTYAAKSKVINDAFLSGFGRVPGRGFVHLTKALKLLDVDHPAPEGLEVLLRIVNYVANKADDLVGQPTTVILQFAVKAAERRKNRKEVWYREGFSL
jgi:hypothetical protein